MERECALRLLVTTDFHGNAKAFYKTALKAKQREIDIVIVCGDVTHFGSLHEAKNLLSLLVPTNVLFVPGNCDPPTLSEIKMDSIESIHGKCKQVGEFNFLGLGGSSPSPFNTPFELSENEIADILDRTSEKCRTGKHTILITHSPPKDTTVDVTSTGEHVGSRSVRKFIEKTRPQLVLCGHIHEAAGLDTVNEMIIVNPGPARLEKCAIIEFDEKIKVQLINL